MRTMPALLPAIVLALAACTGPGGAGAAGTDDWTFTAASPRPSPAAPAVIVEVYKSPTCTCCHAWEAYLRDLGYEVRSIPVDDVAAVKLEHGIPEDAWSCHTALIDGYAVEGHVPAEAIEDLLEDRPAIDGIALAGMPAGSPGMPGVQEDPFEVLAIDDGVATAFGSY